MRMITPPMLRCKLSQGHSPFKYEIKILGEWVPTNRAFVEWFFEFKKRSLEKNHKTKSAS